MKLLFAATLAVTFLAPAYSQLASPNEAGLAMGHIHLNVSDVEASKKFWIGQFDAKPLAVDKESLPGVKVPGMLILFNRKAPDHSSHGTALDHFGFKVRSRDEMTKSLRAAGFEIPREFKGSEGFPNAYVIGPDGLMIELQEETSQTLRAVAQHVHYMTPDPLALRSWYLETFSMPATKRGPHDTADIPGMNLTFAPSKTPNETPTKGGMIDHIGFEVRDLEAFCQKLEASGVRFDMRYRKFPALGVNAAFLTDPRGVSIELTEGLNAF